MEKLLTIKEVSEILSVKESWVRSQIFQKKIAHVKLGRHIRFERDSINEYMEKRKPGNKRDSELESIRKALESLSMRVSAAHYIGNHITYELWKEMEFFSRNFIEALSNEQEGIGNKLEFLPFGEYKKRTLERQAEWEEIKKKASSTENH
jgi:excisionase family DNA binding protein